MQPFHGAFDATLLIGVFNAQHECTAISASIDEIVQRRTQSTQMQRARG
jgi:hypothetical protein